MIEPSPHAVVLRARIHRQIRRTSARFGGEGARRAYTSADAADPLLPLDVRRVLAAWLGQRAKYAYAYAAPVPVRQAYTSNNPVTFLQRHAGISVVTSALGRL